MKRWLMMAVLGLMTLTLATPTAQAASKTLYVGTCKGPSAYATIQSAVDAVNGAGFTISVCPGTYNERVDVTNKQRLTIRGDVEKNQDAPLINAGGGDGVVILDSTNVEIRSLRITNASMAILAANAPKTEVRDTSITNARQYGIFFTASDRSEAHQNTISGSGFVGISVGRTPNVTITQNTVTSFTYGIYVFRSEKATIDANSVSNVGQTAMLLADMTRATVQNNTASFSSYGITLSGAADNTISNNTINTNSTAGILVENSSVNNTFKKNILQGNSVDAIDQSSGSKTAGTANTWSRNTCATSTPAGLCN